MQQLTNIVVHCSDSAFGDAKTINEWHKANGWMSPDGKSIGYHYVILNGCRDLKEGYKQEYDGLIEPGRTLDNDLWVETNEVGAHALGFNRNSLGVCLIGGQGGRKTSFTVKQYLSALFLCSFYSNLIPGIKILGHNETGADKACPVIDMNLFRERLKSFSDMALSLLTSDVYFYEKI
jgi:hypothetical protein